jgi:hypothetical protein
MTTASARSPLWVGVAGRQGPMRQVPLPVYRHRTVAQSGLGKVLQSEGPGVCVGVRKSWNLSVLLVEPSCS